MATVLSVFTPFVGTPAPFNEKTGLYVGQAKKFLYACKQDDSETILNLLNETNNNPNLFDLTDLEENRSCFHYLCQTGKKEILEKIFDVIREKIHEELPYLYLLNLPDGEGYAPYDLALINGHFEVTNLIASYGAKSQFLEVCKQNETDKIRHLLEAVKNNVEFFGLTDPQEGRNCFHYLCLNGKKEILKEIFDFLKIQIRKPFFQNLLNSPDSKGYSPYDLALANLHMEMALLILGYGGRTLINQKFQRRDGGSYSPQLSRSKLSEPSSWRSTSYS